MDIEEFGEEASSSKRKHQSSLEAEPDAPEVPGRAEVKRTKVDAANPGGKKQGGRGTERKGGKAASERKRVRNRNAENEGPSERPEKSEGRPRLAKRKVALLISFCGTGCSGMQFQHTGARTIEGLLFDALIKAGAISEDNSDHPAKVDMQRAARTDAGVHAAGNLVSLKMIIDPPIPDPSVSASTAELTADGSPSQGPTIPATPEQLVARINSFLPLEVRIWSFLRTRNTFNARTACDSRRYEYLFPSWMLLPPKPGSSLAQMIAKSREEAGLPSTSSHSFWSEASPGNGESDEQSVIESDLARKRLWRVDTPTRERLGDVLKEFRGTHNFHNYTLGRDFKDKAAQRFMMRVEVRAVNEISGVEWISVLFHGQSFMLHQIRKMMSMAILSCRTNTPSSLIAETYGSRKVILPMAPALGLLLEQPMFGSYNDRVKVDNAALEKQNLSAEEVASRRRDGIDFEGHQEAIDKFKIEFIYERMREEEAKSDVFDRWIRVMDSYHGDDLTYLNATGTIPESAVLRKNERRRNGLREWKGSASAPLEGVGEEDEGADGMKSKDLEEMEG